MDIPQIGELENNNLTFCQFPLMPAVFDRFLHDAFPILKTTAPFAYARFLVASGKGDNRASYYSIFEYLCDLESTLEENANFLSLGLNTD